MIKCVDVEVGIGTAASLLSIIVSQKLQKFHTVRSMPLGS